MIWTFIISIKSGIWWFLRSNSSLIIYIWCSFKCCIMNISCVFFIFMWCIIYIFTIWINLRTFKNTFCCFNICFWYWTFIWSRLLSFWGSIRYNMRTFRRLFYIWFRYDFWNKFFRIWNYFIFIFKYWWIYYINIRAFI